MHRQIGAGVKADRWESRQFRRQAGRQAGGVNISRGHTCSHQYLLAKLSSCWH
jgi:hypothetical protein